MNLSAIKLIYEFGHWKSLRSLLETRGKMMWESVKLGDFTTFLMRAQTYDKDFRETEDGKVIDRIMVIIHYNLFNSVVY